MPLIIFDFDGTLYHGDDPFRFYACVVARTMSDLDRTTYLEQLDRHLGGTRNVVAGDNWEAVVQLAQPYLVDQNLWQDAFMETRQYMMSDKCELFVSEPLREFLKTMKGRMPLLCASNSPDEAALPLMERLGLLHLFDRVQPAAQKPDGLIAVVESFLGSTPPPETILSVGDNYINDIQPALMAGWATAHISPHGYFPGPSTYRGYTIEDVLPALYTWSEAALSSEEDVRWQK